MTAAGPVLPLPRRGVEQIVQMGLQLVERADHLDGGVTNKNPDRMSDEVTADTTAAFPGAGFLNEPDGLSVQTAGSTIADLPPGSALIVVKRGPNAGSRFLLDQLVTSAG